MKTKETAEENERLAGCTVKRSMKRAGRHIDGISGGGNGGGAGVVGVRLVKGMVGQLSKERLVTRVRSKVHERRLFILVSRMQSIVSRVGFNGEFDLL